jgi:asparagine synthase (glutamine-hydrolysing)
VCGIAGRLAAPGVAPPLALVRRFAAALVHRGPDGEGFYDDQHVALAHRRLAILDLSPHGRQPMQSEDGQIVTIVNGELYNHHELRAELEGRGHRFVGTSDSEVVAHLYEEHGSELFGRLRGMFALAIWDRRRRRLVLARDRAGEKPLYWADGPGGVSFASELTALLMDDALGREVDLDAVDDYLALQYVPAPRTIFAGIHKLPPGHLLEAEPGRPPEVRPYYRLTPAEAPADEGEAIERVRAAVDEAVRSRLMSDVPLGAFLSGGIDSSIVVACMARASSRPIETFSIGFPEAADSELPFARLVAERYATAHHEHVVSPDMIGVLPRIVRHHGEPFGDPSALPTWYLCEMTRQKVTVALSGDGGDEAFGGYRRYAWAHNAHRILALPRPLAATVALALRALPGGPARWVREYGAHLGADEAARYLRFISHFSAGEKRSIYQPELAARFADDRTARRFAELLARSSRPEPLGKLMDLDRETYLPDDILTKVDRASMAHSLEARAPLVDHHVLELAAAIPSGWALRRGKGKQILKRAFADLVPAEILHRKKKGFSLPLARWFRAELAGHARDLLTDDTARRRGLFRPDAAAELLTRHAAGEDHGDRLWNLLVLELWFRELVDGRAALVAEVDGRLAASGAAAAWRTTAP